MTDSLSAANDLKAEFAARLTTLRTEAELSVAALAGRLGVAKGTVSGWGNGNFKSAPELGKVHQWVHFCAEKIAQKNRKPSVTTDRSWWRERHRGLEVALGHDSRRRRQARSAGTRVSECQPLLLGVHRGIVLGTQPADELVPYLVRPHDRQVRRILDEAASPRLVVVTGGSCVGKTRALWEAVRSCLPAWDVVRPGSAADLIGVVTAGTVGARTVVWLDELADILDDPDSGEQAARALLELVTTSKRPIVVVGSMWTSRWENLVAPGGAPGRHRTVRSLLLDHAQEVVVPDRWDGDRPQELADPRAVLAFDTAGEDGKIVQFLAGGTQMLARYRRASNPLGTALVTAVLDIARLGVRLPSTTMLLGLVPAYVTAQAQRVAGDDWQDHALAHATEEVQGVALLTPHRTAPGIGPADSLRLHDYVLQLGQSDRKGVRLPAALWTALTEQEASAADLLRLADSARRRMQYEQAEVFYRRLIDLGHPHTAYELAKMYGTQDRLPDAIAELRAVVEHTQPYIRAELARFLVKDGQIEEALEEYRAVLNVDYKMIRPEMADLLARVGRTEEAMAEYRLASDEGWLMGREQFGELLAGAGRLDEAIAELQKDIDRGMSHAGAAIARLVAKHGDPNTAVELLRDYHQQGGRNARTQLVCLLRSLGRGDEADDLLLAEGAAGDISARIELGWVYATRGDHAAAIEQYRQVPADRSIADELIKSLRAVGRDDEADVVLADQLEKLEKAASAGDAKARADRAWLLVRAGRTAEGIAEMRIAAEADDMHRWALARLLEIHGTPDEAFAEMRAAGEDGVVAVHGELVRQLEGRGLAEQADALRRKGFAIDGSTP